MKKTRFIKLGPLRVALELGKRAQETGEAGGIPTVKANQPQVVVSAQGGPDMQDIGGNVTTAADITDHAIVRGDGGTRGIQDSPWSISDAGVMSTVANSAGIDIGAATNTNTQVWGHKVQSDSADRMNITGGGAIKFGSGAATADVELSRLAANVLGLAADDAFCVQGGASTPASGIDGTLFYNTTNDEMMLRANGAWVVLNDSEAVHGAATKTSDTTVANTTTKTSVFSWTVPADQWQVGTQFQLDLHMSGTAFTGTPNLVLTIEDGTNTLVTHTFATLGLGQHGYHVQSMLTCRTDGASGGISGVSAATGFNETGAAIFNRSAANTDTTDTTASNTYTVYLQWSAANAVNSMTVTGAGVLRIN